jgi:class 3 adenylate cyclase
MRAPNATCGANVSPETYDRQQQLPHLATPRPDFWKRQERAAWQSPPKADVPWLELAEAHWRRDPIYRTVCSVWIAAMVQERPIRVERRLSAILAADVAGYSRLMHQAEEATHAKLTALLASGIGPAITEHSGRIVKNTGDGFLAEFSSAVEAVRAAVQFQARINELTTEEAEDSRIAFRAASISAT